MKKSKIKKPELPNGINAKQISAKFENGIFKITIPRVSDGKKISIE